MCNGTQALQILLCSALYCIVSAYSEKLINSYNANVIVFEILVSTSLENAYFMDELLKSLNWNFQLLEYYNNNIEPRNESRILNLF